MPLEAATSWSNSSAAMRRCAIATNATSAAPNAATAIRSVRVSANGSPHRTANTSGAGTAAR